MRTFKILLFVIFLILIFRIGVNASESKKIFKAPTITILPLEDNYCAGSVMMIAFEVSSDFEQDNVFTAELSDQFGNFDNPLEIGILNSNTSGIIPATLPKSLVEGNSYRVRIKSTNPDTVSNDNGNNIYIYALPDMTIDGEFEPCKQGIYTYSTPQDFKFSYLWSVSGGYFITDSTQSSVDIEWGTSQEYGYLTLVKKNNMNGCSDTSVVQLSLKSAPLTQINAGKSKVCIAEVASYYASSSSVVPSEWNVYGGALVSSSDNMHADVLWTQLGEGWVELVKSNEYGCIGRDTFFVEVFPVPIASFSGPQKVVENSISVYKANFEENLMYFWNITGGEIIQDDGDSIIVKWVEKGVGKVKLIESYIGSGCSDTLEKEITIMESLPDFEITGKTTVCAFSLENYKIDLTYHVIIKWTVENGKIIGPDNDYSVTINWQNAGNGVVHCRLISTESGDTSSSEINVKIRDLPKITIEDNLKFCLNDGPYTLDFAKPEGGSYQGNGVEDNIFYPERVGLGFQNITYNYTDSYGCSNSEIVQIEVVPNPEKPEIFIDKEGIYTNYESGNIWYVDGKIIAGDNDNRLDWSQIDNLGDEVWVVHIDSNGCESPESDRIEVAVTEFDGGLKFYPNPASDNLVFSLKNMKNIDFQTTIYDVYGNILQSIKFNKNNFDYEVKIDLKGFANGVYFIKLQTGERVWIEKFIISK